MPSASGRERNGLVRQVCHDSSAWRPIDGAWHDLRGRRIRSSGARAFNSPPRCFEPRSMTSGKRPAGAMEHLVAEASAGGGAPLRQEIQRQIRTRPARTCARADTRRQAGRDGPARQRRAAASRADPAPCEDRSPQSHAEYLCVRLSSRDPGYATAMTRKDTQACCPSIRSAPREVLEGFKRTDTASVPTA